MRNLRAVRGADLLRIRDGEFEGVLVRLLAFDGAGKVACYCWLMLVSQRTSTAVRVSRRSQHPRRARAQVSGHVVAGFARSSCQAAGLKLRRALVRVIAVLLDLS